MKRSVLLFLFYSLIFLGPNAVFSEDPKPKAETNSSEGGDKGLPPSVRQGQTTPQGDADSDAEKPKARKPGPRPTAIDVITEHGGKKGLSIHFRWSLYPNSSVEVRLAPGLDNNGADNKGATLAPVYFAEHLKGKVRDELFKCLDHTGDGGYSYSFSKDKISYKMIGRRNSLDKQGVHVAVSPEETKKGVEENPAAAYLQLDTWAVDLESLSLDLERDEFAKPGTLFVWFFRGEQVVWEEQIRWPGYK
jgi:hypothetical protein